MTPTQDMIAEVERLDAAATKGPWRAYANGGIYASDEEGEEKVAECFEPKRQQLIAYYRTAAPALATELRKAHEEVERLREAAEEGAKVLGMLDYTDYETVDGWPTRHVRDAALRKITTALTHPASTRETQPNSQP